MSFHRKTISNYETTSQILDFIHTPHIPHQPLDCEMCEIHASARDIFFALTVVVIFLTDLPSNQCISISNLLLEYSRVRFSDLSSSDPFNKS